jgi:hypothetical protein
MGERRRHDVHHTLGKRAKPITEFPTGFLGVRDGVGRVDRAAAHDAVRVSRQGLPGVCPLLPDEYECILGHGYYKFALSIASELDRSDAREQKISFGQGVETTPVISEPNIFE